MDFSNFVISDIVSYSMTPKMLNEIYTNDKMANAREQSYPGRQILFTSTLVTLTNYNTSVSTIVPLNFFAYLLGEHCIE